jgi:hypothetical protein
MILLQNGGAYTTRSDRASSIFSASGAREKNARKLSRRFFGTPDLWKAHRSFGLEVDGEHVAE